MAIAIVNDTSLRSEYSVAIPISEDQKLSLTYYQTGIVNIEKLLPSCFHASESLFYYLSPDASVSFIAAGLHAAPDNFNPESFFSALLAAQVPVWSPAANLPILFHRKFFNLAKNDILWADFSADWLIPEYVIFNSGNSTTILCIDCDNSRIETILAEGTDKLFDFFDGNHNVLHSMNFTSDCDLHSFTGSINVIQSEIADGTISKAVFSRKQTAPLAKPDFSRFLSVLPGYPSTHRFLFKSGSSVFSGASPELLLTLKGSRLTTEALAGTALRGSTPEMDEAIAFRLLHDEKELLEHRIVTDYITRILSNFTGAVRFSPHPGIKKLSSLQHLWTPIQADLTAPGKIFSIIEELFPTPATCGYPRKESLDLINRLEQYSRGLYCGAIAWTDLTGNVESFIPLRSALFAKDEVHIFSGGGIVAASSAEAEFEENNKKSDSIKNLFFI